jgi:hypothetical protein
MTVVAARLAAEQVEALLLLLRELRTPRKHGIEFLSERRDFRRRLITGDRLRHLIVGGHGSPTVDRAQTHHQRITSGRRTRAAAHLFYITGPCDGESLPAPHAFK